VLRCLTSLTAILLVFPGAAFAQTPPDRLAGSSWRLVRFAGSDGKAIRPDAASKYTIDFGTDGRVTAQIDCNRGRSTWKSSGAGRLEFGPFALTRAMCPPAPLNDRLPGDLSAVRSYTIRNDHLFLPLVADGGVYEFEPMSSGEASNQPAASLENTNWRLTSLGDTPVTATSPAPHITLDQASRRVNGSGGCNRITGSYELDGNRLRFSHMAATLMACAAGLDTEKAFLHALEQVRTWKAPGQQLELDDADGHPVARFEARPAK
jgi:heat shock protein HslJ